MSRVGAVQVQGAALYLAALVGVAVLLAAFAATHQAEETAADASRAAEQLSEVTRAGDALVGFIADAETGQRGFLLTGRDRYLEAYDRGREQAPIELARLRQLTAADLPQRERATRLEELTDAKLEELADTIRMRREAGLTAALEVVDSDRGKDLMDKLRATTAQLKSSADRAAEVQERRAQAASQRAGEVGRAAGALLLALLMVMVVLVAQRGRSVRARAAAESAREQLVTELAALATRDPLTGLPNRRLLEDRIEQALRRAGRDRTLLALFFVNLDRFTDVNDTHGHTIGDDLLVAVAARLGARLRESDTLASCGGDEFVVLCEGLLTNAEALTAAARLEQTLTAGSVVVGEHSFRVTASVGIAVADHDHVHGAPGKSLPATPAALLSAAGVAMHQAKADGGAQSRVYDPTVVRGCSDRHRLLCDLRQALEFDDGQLWVAYQPLVSLADEQVMGVEALLRWNHPTRGPVSPTQFIPLAEESRLILPLGERVLHQTCGQGAAWNRDRAVQGLDPLKMSVNVSAHQLLQPDFPATVRAALASSGLAPRHLALEITETVLVDGAHRAAAHLRELAALGVTLSLDDFGTGYSSLAYLRKFPIDLIKIDRSFVSGLGRNPADETIVRTIIGLAHNLERTVLAEGIETVEQARCLRAMGCDYGQGYHYGRPRPPGDPDAPAAIRRLCSNLARRRAGV